MLRFFFPCATIVVVSIPVLANEGGRTARDLAKGLADADSSAVAGKVYAEFFKGLKSHEIAQIQHDEQLDIAINSSWALHKQLVNRSVSDDANRRIQEGKHAARFLGFLEARTKLPIPQWWEAAIYDPVSGPTAEWNAIRESRDQTLEDQSPPAGKLWGEDLRLPRNVILHRSGEWAVGQVGKKSVRLPAAEFDAADRGAERRPWNSCAVEVGDDASFIALYDESFGAACPLACVDTRTGKVKWRTQIWSTGFENVKPTPLSGFSDHYLELRRHDKQLAVFGMDNSDCSLEIFRLEDGKPLLRFSTNNWNVSGADDVSRPGSTK